MQKNNMRSENTWLSPAAYLNHSDFGLGDVSLLQNKIGKNMT